LLAIGIAGTVKNSGKTTTTAVLAEELAAKSLPLALTSIGYDGERADNVTRLPKPRLTVLSGQWVATAERCLAVSTARLKVAERSEVFTPLGRVVYARVTEPGLVVLAGPNKTGELREILRGLARLGAQVCLVDGALNRLVPMAETRGIILATGAARFREPARLALEVRVFEELLNLPLGLSGDNFQGISIQGTKEQSWAGRTSILQAVFWQEVAANLTAGTTHLVVPGIIAPTLLPQVSEELLARGITLVLEHPLKLLATGDPIQLSRDLRQLTRAHLLQVQRRTPLLAVTVNPFYPRYRFDLDVYESAYLNAAELRQVVGQSLKVPVVDVKQESPAPLVREVLNLI